jgi:hypothetical protein
MTSLIVLAVGEGGERKILVRALIRPEALGFGLGEARF